MWWFHVWCNWSDWGLNLFLLDKNTCLLISAVPFKVVSLLIYTQIAQRLQHDSKHFMKCIVWNTASPSCDFAEVMVISLSEGQWSADCGPWPFWKWPTDNSVIHNTKITDTLTLSYASRVSREGPVNGGSTMFGDNIFKMSAYFRALAVCWWRI